MIRLEGVGRSYTLGAVTVPALRHVDLHIARGEYVAVTGSSGSGKSTLMNLLGCLDRPTAGRYELNGRDVAALSNDELADVRNREIGFVFQSFHLLPKLSAQGNVAQPLVYRGVAAKERARLATEALARVGLADRQHHRPNELSGGQRQRVAIARALVGAPAIVLADEPTGNLDSDTTQEILALLDELHRAGQTIILVTHEREVAERCERVVRIQDGNVVSDVAARPAVGASGGAGLSLVRSHSTASRFGTQHSQATAG